MEHNRLSRNEIQSAELQILVKLASFLDSNNIPYSLACGTLLGAVRHKGFIPWDDDVDICIPRPHYDKLLSLKEKFEQETSLVMRGLKDLPLDIAPIIKICDPAIQVLERGSVKPGFLWVDVFPLDAISDNEETALLIQSKSQLWQMLLAAKTSPVSSGKTLLRKGVKAVVKTISIPLSKKTIAKKLKSLALKTPYGTSRYITNITFFQSILGSRIGPFDVNNLEEIEFEHHFFKTVQNPDNWLKGAYGDYMTLPPEDRRETHSLIAWPAESI